MNLDPRPFWERLKARALREAFIVVYGEWLRGDSNLGAPDRRDLHLFLLADELVLRLSWSRYSFEELILLTCQKYPQASASLNDDLVWRALTLAERRRWVIRAETLSNGQGEFLWDITKEGETQSSSVRLVSEKLRVGALIGFCGLTVAVFTGEVADFARIVLVLLVGGFLFQLVQIAFLRSLVPYGIDLMNAREAEIHEALSRGGAEPWWPPRPETRASSTPGQ
jgi:hypothetical protein